MVEKTNNITPDATVQNTAQGQEWAASEKKVTDKVRTPGWNLFDKIVHFGINFGLNVVGATITAHFMTKHEINKKVKNGEKGYSKKDISKLPGENIKIPFSGGSNFYEAYDKFEKSTLKAYHKLNKKTGSKVDDDTVDVAGGITVDVLMLSFAGHITTAMTQLFENDKVKPKLVRWLDKNITDPLRKTFGKGPDAAELEERKQVYDKLDNELSGKSFSGTWGARFFAIGVVIASLFGLRQLDKFTFGRNSKPEFWGLNRLKQGVLWSADKGYERQKEGKTGGFTAPWKDPKSTASQSFYAKRMSTLFATELTGSGTTASIQFLYLMAKEFFGIGVDTNTKKKKPKANENTALASNRTDTIPAPQIAAKTEETVEETEEVALDEKAEKAANYRAKNQPVGNNYQDKALASQQETTMEQTL